MLTLQLKQSCTTVFGSQSKYVDFLRRRLLCDLGKFEWNGPHSTIYAIAWASVAVTEKYEQL